MRPAVRFVLAGLLLGGAWAQEYRVDPGGGPSGLETAVGEAFAAWAAVEGAQVEAEATQDAPNLIRYGEATRMGPDTVTLTLSRGSGRDAGLTVLVNPEAQNLLRPALLHETGLLLGLNAAEEGVMNPVLSEDSPTEPAESDRAALTAQATSAPEDVNQDGVVNFYDLAALAADYGRSGVNLASDVNGDGVVDDRDLALLREAYVFSPPAEMPPTAAEPGAEPEEDALPEVPETGAPADEAPGGMPNAEGAPQDEPPGPEDEQETPEGEGEAPAQDDPESGSGDTDDATPSATEEPPMQNDSDESDNPDQSSDQTP